MCGRYSITSTETDLTRRFGAELGVESVKVRYNAAPSQDLPVIANTAPTRIMLYRWGLIPSWAKDNSIGNRMINARAETIAEKPAFRKAIRTQRCLALADGFYEWKKTPRGKNPYRIALKNNEPFAFAGVWESWMDEKGHGIRSFAIITVEPNSLLAEIHNRMPAILLRQNENVWLSEISLSEALAMLLPYPAELMEAYPVSKLVSSPSNDFVEVIHRVRRSFEEEG